MKIQKKLNIISLTIGSIVAAIPLSTINLVSQINNKSNINSKNLNASKALTYSHHYAQNNIETISNESGPIFLKENGKIITNHDWYGNVNWSLDVSQVHKGSSKIVDWDYMSSHNWIFIITDKSYAIKINSFNGEILARSDISTIVPSANKLARIDFNDSLYAWNSNNTSSKIVKLDRNTLVEDKNGITNGNTNGALVNIIPLDVGYSIGVYADLGITDDSSVSKLTLKYIDDNGAKISGSTDESITLSPSKIIKDIAIYGFKRKVNANSTLLIVDNKFYEIKLNKSSIGESTVAPITLQIGTTPQAINNVNSAFMDDNEIVYFKEKGGNKIYQIDFNNSLTISTDLTTTNDTTIKQIVANTDNMLQVFPVPYTSNNRTYITKGNVYLTDTDNTYLNGIVNKSLYGTSGLEGLKPEIKIKNDQYSNILSSNVPSVVDQSYFSSVNADTLDPLKVKLIADDINGTLDVTAEVTKKAWFDNSSNVKTTSLIHKSYKASDNGSVKPKRIIDQISWATQTSFQSQFGKYTPDQLVESNLDQWNGLITIKGISSKDYFRNLTKKIAIKSRDKNKGEITLSGVVTYSDKYGNYINTPLIDQKYIIKKSDGTYGLKFHGATNNANGVTQDQTTEATNKDINVSDINDSEDILKLKNFLPSLIEPSEYEKFIKEENSYVPSRRTITKVANDDAGTMELTITYNGFAASVPYKFKQKFTGFLTTSQFNVEFKGDNEEREEINNQFKDEKPKSIISISEYNNFKDNVSTEIQAAQLGNIYSSKLDGMGYKPNIIIEPLDDKDVEYGSIKVTLDYSEKVGENKKLKEPYKNKFGLNEYKITQRYTGLLPIGVRFKMEIDPNKANEVIHKYDIDSNIPPTELVSILDLKEYKQDEISISSFLWNGEKFEFLATAQSKKYTSVQQSKKFILDWSPRFKNVRDRNMAIAVSVAIGGAAAISSGVALYILRRNRIRRLLK